MVTSTRQTRIANIIKTREPFLKEIVKKQTELSDRSKTIYALEQLQTEIMKNGSPLMADRVRDLQLLALRQKIVNTIKELEKPKSRFSRSTLNIGVIGRARQGKSRLLQSLSGLSSEVIPTGSAGHCTGVRSLICHDPNQRYGEITFYSEREFLEEVIAPYYQELGLGNPPLNMHSFINTPLPLLPPSSPNMQNKYIQSAEMYRHLVDYKKNIQSYVGLINSAPRRIPIQNVREYVAQDSIDGQTSYFKYMAVKEARIVCTFAYHDVGQIALVDMPGLGDTGVGAEERLIAALGEHLDVVLFVLMPSPAAGILQDVDFGLYDLAYHALSGLPIDRWSYMILNRTHPPVPNSSAASNIVSNSSASPHFGDNNPNCERIKNLIISGSTGAAGRSIKVVKPLIVDCSNATEAKDTILEEVLQYLVQNMKGLDTLYMSSWQQRLAQLNVEITNELEKARLALEASLSQSQDDKAFEGMFQTMWEKFATSLDDLVLKLERESQTPDAVFSNYFQRTFTKCRNDTLLPSEKDIRFNRGDTYAYISTLNHHLNEMRTHLTYHFVDIDDQLHMTMDGVKTSVSEVFLNDGQLAEWFANTEKSLFFSKMADEPMLSGKLQTTFKVFAQYELSLRGFFQSRIRQCLDQMVPDKVNVQMTNPSSAEALNKLKQLHQETVSKLESTLENYKHEPSDAAFAVVEEFVDQVCRSKDVKESWRAFYRTNKAVIWKTEFAKSAKWEDLQREWQSRVKAALEVHNASALSKF